MNGARAASVFVDAARERKSVATRPLLRAATLPEEEDQKLTPTYPPALR